MIPTLYGGEFGPDLQSVADYNNLTIDQVIEFHSSTKYLIYALGFSVFRATEFRISRLPTELS